MAGCDGDRGVSPVVGIVLLVAIAVTLAGATALTLTSSSDDDLTGPSSTVAVEFDEAPTHTSVGAEATRARVDQLLIKVNGETTKIWENYSAGQTKNLYCLEEGDDVSIVGATTGSDGEYESTQVLARHEMQGTTLCQFNVTNGGSSTIVRPVNWDTSDEDAKSFYSYGGQDGTGHAHAHIDDAFTEPNSSYMFFYVYDDVVSLIVVHDQPGVHGGHCSIDEVDGCNYDDTDLGGGSVDMWFENLPESTDPVVKDDPSDFNRGSACTGWSAGVNPEPGTVQCFTWYNTHTDGGVYRSGFTDTRPLNITVHTRWNADSHLPPLNAGEITDWKFVSRAADGSLVTTDLDMDSTLVIEGANEDEIADG